MKTKLAIATLLLSQACATVFTGTKQSVQFDSVPTDARVEVSGQSCQTPCVLKLPKGEPHIAKYTKDGFAPQNVTLNKEFNAVSVLNFFGLIWWAVDIGTGAMYNVAPGAVSANLQSNGPAPASVQ
jgi:hypothetical protein